MKAACYSEFGPAGEVLQICELDRPQPGQGEILVRLAASSVNPSDVKKRAGASPGLLDGGFIIPHSDGAGVIEAVGAGISSARIGERVWVYQAQHERRFGTAAEYAALDARRAVPLPDHVDFDTGACIGIPVMTSHRCVFADGPVEGRTVVVTGGAGRVGNYAVQWASMAGARVIATASNEADAEACRQAGAAAVVNHRQPGWGARAVEANDGQRVDRVIDSEFGANLPEVLDVIRTSGTLVSYGSARLPEPRFPFYRAMYLDLLIRLVIVYAMPEAAKEAAIDDIHEALSADRLQHRFARTLPLDDVAEAHRLIEEGALRGSVVLRIG